MNVTWDPFRKINEPLERWWLRDVLGQVYQIEQDVLVCGKPHKPRARIAIDRIDTWQIMQPMAGTFVELRTLDGKSSSWPDRYDELVKLLKRTIPTKELPWIPE